MQVCYLNTKGTEVKWAMEEVQKSSCGSLLVRKTAVAADLLSLLGSEDLLPQPFAYSES